MRNKNRKQAEHQRRKKKKRPSRPRSHNVKALSLHPLMHSVRSYALPSISAHKMHISLLTMHKTPHCLPIAFSRTQYALISEIFKYKIAFPNDLRARARDTVTKSDMLPATRRTEPHQLRSLSLIRGSFFPFHSFTSVCFGERGRAFRRQNRRSKSNKQRF